MQVDRNTLNKLLSLNDKQLEAVMRKLGEEYGLDLSQFRVSPDNMSSLRQALRTATDEDLVRLGEQLKKGRGRP